MSPLVTVYIPTHNRKDLVVRAIKSVLSQTYENIELIIVDDGSKDDTEAHLHDYINSGKIHFIRNTISKGACYCRNLAIRAAKGEFITGLDDDDEFTPNRISNFMDEYSDKNAFLFTGYILKETLGLRKWHRGPNEQSLSDLLKRNTVGNQIFIHKDKVLEVGGFDEALPAWQDHDLWIRLTERFGSAKRLDTYTYIVDTTHPHESISKNLTSIHTAYKIFQQKYPQYTIPKYRRFLQLNYYQYPGIQFTFLEFLSYLPTSAAKRAIKVFIDKNFIKEV